MLEQVEEASDNLAVVRGALWKAYEGMVSVQDACSKVYSASATVDTIHNKLSILRDTKEPALVKDEDIDSKIDPETKDCDAFK